MVKWKRFVSSWRDERMLHCLMYVQLSNLYRILSYKINTSILRWIMVQSQSQIGWVYVWKHNIVISRNFVPVITTLRSASCRASYCVIANASFSMFVFKEVTTRHFRQFEKYECVLGRHPLDFFSIIVAAIFYYRDRSDFQFCDWCLCRTCTWDFLSMKESGVCAEWGV